MRKCCRSLPVGVAIALLSAAAGVPAQELHKCAGADGAIAYQDRPCPAGSTALPAPAVAAGSSGLSPLTGAYAVPSPAAVPAADPAPDAAPVPLPSLYRCQSADGRSYVGSDPNPPGRFVPLWTLSGWPSARAPVGASPPRPPGPGKPKPPAAAPGAGAGWPATVGAGYTFVQDQCRAMSRGELCAYWRTEIDRVGAARRTAFQAERATLDAQQRELRERFAAHCR